LKLHVMNVCTNSANVNSWVRGRLLYELWRMTGTADTDGPCSSTHPPR
jgi:hypothetical protein